MELEKLIAQHETKLKQHDKELARLNDTTVEMQKQMNDSLSRVDESNRFLREQNTKQLEQNGQILQAVLNGNDSAAQRKYELNLIDKKNLWKAIFGIGGTIGTVIAIVLRILHFI